MNIGGSGYSGQASQAAQGAQDPERSQRRQEFRKFRQALEGDTSDEAKALKEALGSLKRGQQPSEADLEKVKTAMAAWQKTSAAQGITIPDFPPAGGPEGAGKGHHAHGHRHHDGDGDEQQAATARMMGVGSTIDASA